MAPIVSGHEDVIQDVAYDFYGRRIATCSSDRKINIFEHDGETQSWLPSASWKAHDAAIIQVCWAHPKYGQVIVSCSLDRTIKIWKRTQGNDNNILWAEKARLQDSRAGILQVSFSPIHLGLKLASIAGDAIIRIYESTDPETLTNWTLQDEISALRPNAPPQHSGETSFALSWCPSSLGGQQLVVAANNFVSLYRPDERSQWQSAELLQDDAGLVRCVSWAPGGRRGYELIAAGSKAGIVRIYKLTESSEGVIVGGGGYVIEKIAEFEVKGALDSDVQRVAWNVTGTVLSSSGDDGRIRIWKEDHLGKWRQQFALSAEQNPRDSEMQDDIYQ